MTTETASPERIQQVNSSRDSIYDKIFWLTYAANVSLVAANALTFRFADFVKFLGGTEETTGAIAGTALLGALAARWMLGQGIDRYGTRILWRLGSVLFIASMSLFVVVDRLDAWIYVARTGYAVGISMMFTCSMVHAQNRVPAARRTEVIGNLGSSGFVGMICGAQLGDLILALVESGRMQYVVLFGTTVLLSTVYLGLVITITRRDVHDRPHETPAAHSLLLRYWPGPVVLVAMMMGTALTVTTVFLTRYVNHLGLSHGFGAFFTGYAISAFSFRLLASKWSRSIGRHRMILFGLCGHALGFAILPYMTRDWMFLIPATSCGFGHALLFPAVVSLGAGAFPKQYRGTGTTITLGFFDLGMALSAPFLGRVIDQFDGVGFTPMFYTAMGMMLIVATFYTLTAGRHPDVDAVGETEEQVHPRGLPRVETAPHPAPRPEPVPALCSAHHDD
ncbi:MFS transporter [Thalassoroseus pseudoceratinae]|uniref:MFS transporter n=1 Tax=Thalassoroseus pseudoceratinae TaxID=2713176 RepID=UPI001423E568|nr:MFS transporter [Thalassoroseus pseudoceratinae]